MGTLGEYLREARVAKEMDLRDAAQQTRISLQYLKALEDEDFSKLPGEVFVRGFLKNYCRFLDLDESEVMKRYAELKPKGPTVSVANQVAPRYPEETEVPTPRGKTPLEPFVWGTVIVLALIAFLFVSLPGGWQNGKPQLSGPISPTVQSEGTGTTTTTVTVPKTKPMTKLYLKIVALEDTWLLIRTDGSPQKKAVLKQGESLIWSADERFVLSYGSVGALKLLLNGEELSVQGEPDMPVRDLIVTGTGIMRQPYLPRRQEPVKRHPVPAAEPKPHPAPLPESKPEAKSKPATESVHSQPTKMSPAEAPTAPKPSEPKPSEPKPSEPKPSEPKPLSPSPVQSGPVGTTNPQ